MPCTVPVWHRACLTVLLILIPVFIVRADEGAFQRAEDNARRARDAWVHCSRFVDGWLKHADPRSGLIPRNLTQSLFWNARDAAADNYPFMVLTASMTDRALFAGRLREMLRTEQRLTCRLGALPDDFSFATQHFRTEAIDHAAIIFGASEYAKDGLTPLTEWLGPSAWSERLVSLLDGILAESKTPSQVGPLPADSHEVNGEMMQTLARFYWMNRNEAYRTMAFRIADHYLLHRLPIDEDRLSFDDHGCEVIGGLSEVYYLAAHTDPSRRERYRDPMHAILDRALAVGRNADGYFYNAVNPKTGKVLRDGLTDNWGYNYNAFLTVADLDDHVPYRQAVSETLGRLHTVEDYAWEGGGADGYADAIEGAINLLNRLPSDAGFRWVDERAAIMLAKQRPDGIIEGWHGDGNYARTAILYALWKTKGLTIDPWRADVIIGAEHGKDGALRVVIRSDWPWTGKILFDRPRHREYLHLPTDYPRLNQFPEWFTADRDTAYDVQIGDDDPVRHIGKDLVAGLVMTTKPETPLRITVRQR